MLCGGAFSIQVIRRVVTLKSNCISRGDCSTKCAWMIHTFATFGSDFRCWNNCISEIPPPIITHQYYWILFCQSISSGRCEMKKLYVAKQRWSMRRKFFEKFDFLLDFKNRKFCLDMLSPSTSVYFSGPAGGRSLRARVPYVTRRAVSL